VSNRVSFSNIRDRYRPAGSPCVGEISFSITGLTLSPGRYWCRRLTFSHSFPPWPREHAIMHDWAASLTPRS
jgi:hypothetical protein